jgi:hypothetical protein
MKRFLYFVKWGQHHIQECSKTVITPIPKSFPEFLEKLCVVLRHGCMAAANLGQFVDL